MDGVAAVTAAEPAAEVSAAPAAAGSAGTAGAARRVRASLFSARGKLAVDIVELFGEGAVIACEARPPCGSYAYLVRDGVKLPVLISWTASEHVGLAFEAPLPPDRLAQLAPQEPAPAPLAA